MDSYYRWFFFSGIFEEVIILLFSALFFFKLPLVLISSFKLHFFNQKIFDEKKSIFIRIFEKKNCLNFLPIFEIKQWSVEVDTVKGFHPPAHTYTLHIGITIAEKYLNGIKLVYIAVCTMVHPTPNTINPFMPTGRHKWVNKYTSI